MIELARIKKEYDRVKSALEEVEATGYGIVMPTMDQLRLEEPEIMRQGGRYGVRLKAGAPSIHMMRADIITEVAPVVGSEKQSEELVRYLLGEFEENPHKIWESNIFGKSLHELVNEGLRNKLYRMPADARLKMQETIERIINEGCSGLICIIL
jgi:stage IV sporulation protein A